MNPAVIESSSAPDRQKPIYAYRIDGDHKAVRLVFRTAGGAYWGVEETDWEDAPILGDKSFRHVLGGRAYDFYYNGPKLHMIVLRQDGATYWVVNSLLDNVSNETMIAMAKGLRPLKGASNLPADGADRILRRGVRRARQRGLPRRARPRRS